MRISCFFPAVFETISCIVQIKFHWIKWPNLVNGMEGQSHTIAKTWSSSPLSWQGPIIWDPKASDGNTSFIILKSVRKSGRILGSKRDYEETRNCMSIEFCSDPFETGETRRGGSLIPWHWCEMVISQLWAIHSWAKASRHHLSRYPDSRLHSHSKLVCLLYGNPLWRRG